MTRVWTVIRHVAALGAVALGYAVLSCTVSAASAVAADTVVNFDTLTAGTSVTNQFQHAGGSNQGVIFGVTPPNPPPPTTRELPVVTAFADTSSPPDVGQISRTMPCGLECTRPPGIVWGRFPFVKTHVSVSVGDVTGTTSDKITLTAYDSVGHSLGSDAQSVTGGAGVHTVLQVSTGTAKISYFSITNSNAFLSFGIDDVSFDAPPPSPPPPDYSIAVGQAGTITLGQGSSVSVPIGVGRTNGSSGTIALSATPSEQGIHATFVPSSASEPDGETVQLQLTADADAAPDDNALVTVTADPSPTAGTGQKTLVIPLRVVRFDLRAKGIEVTQAVQAAGDLTPSGIGGSGAYQGVGLAAGGITIARLYADASGSPTGGVTGVSAVLVGTRNGQPLPGSPLDPTSGPRTVAPSTDDNVTQADRANPESSFYFELPPSWTHGNIDLRGEVELANAPPGITECASTDCSANNSFTLTDVPFTVMKNVVIRPLALLTPGQTAPDPTLAYLDAQAILPLGDGQLRVLPYQDTIDVTDEEKPGDVAACQHHMPPDKDNNYDVQCALLSVVEDNVDSNHPDDYSIGLTINAVNGLTSTIPGHTAVVDATTANTPSGFNRPLSSLAHEFGHELGLRHASSSCGAGGAVSWPPDQFGFLQGVGLDHRYGSSRDFTTSPPSLSEAPFRIMSDTPYDPTTDLTGITTTGTNVPVSQNKHYFDFMSYCAFAGQGDPDSWISPRYWTQLFDSLKSSSTSPDLRVHTASNKPGQLRVIAYLRDGSIRITNVGPGAGLALPTGIAFPYHAVALDRSGKVIADVPLRGETTGHIDGTVTEPFASLGAILNAPGAARVEVRLDSTVEDTVVRSAHAPSVHFISPRAGRLVGGGKSVTIRWRSRDPDHNRLLARLEYSADGGRHWNTVFTGDDHGRAVLPSSYLSASKRAQLRLHVNDGFNETEVTSKLFRARGGAPTVRVLAPGAGSQISSASPLYLSASAFDDAATPLNGRALTWFAGSLEIGTGSPLSVAGLPPGTDRIRAVARDRLGRTRTASVTVQVLATPASFTTLSAPAHAGRHAHQLTLTAASTAPATMTVTGRGVARQQFIVGRHAQHFALRIKPGKKALTLHASLAGGPTETLHVPRR
jgi:hypothetical protein